MPANRYEFVTRWRIPATPEQVYRVIEAVQEYPQWWPAVWLNVEELNPGDANRVGSVHRLTSKGWLPYTLNWTSTTVEKMFAERIRLEASGDFRGHGVWTFRPDGEFTAVEYLWVIEAEKPLLRYLSFALKPLFRANHNWAMKTGEVSLKLELRRRAAMTDAERAAVPSPPRPTFVRSRPAAAERLAQG